MGYIRASMSTKDNTKVSMLLHQVVGQTFLENSENKPTIDHIDRDPGNIDIENLRWADRSEQCYNRNLENMGRGNGKMVMKVEGREKTIFLSIKDSGKSMGISKYKMEKILSGTGKIGDIEFMFHGEDEVIENEIFVSIVRNGATFEVSTEGRVCLANGRVNYGNPHPSGYLTTTSGGVTQRINILVGHAFKSESYKRDW